MAIQLSVINFVARIDIIKNIQADGINVCWIMAAVMTVVQYGTMIIFLEMEQ